MTATQTELRRGTRAQVLAMVPAPNEVVVNTTDNRLHLGDGTTFGGIPLPNMFDLQNGYGVTAQDTGTVNHIVVAYTPATNGTPLDQTLVFQCLNTNTGPTDIAVDTHTAVAISKPGGGAIVALDPGDLVAGAFYTVRKASGAYILEGGAGSGVQTLTAADTSVTVTASSGAATVAINTNNSNGIGAYNMCVVNAVNLTIPNGTTVAGSSISPMVFLMAGSGVNASTGFSPSTALTGTWRNVSGNSIVGHIGTTGRQGGMFIRVA